MQTGRIASYLASLVAVSTLFVLSACGGPRGGESTTGAPPHAVSAEPGARDAGATDAAPDKPFAGSGAEATQLVSAAIDKHREAMADCVEAYRARKKLPTQRVEVQVGIDQEGILLGATLAKTKSQDPELSACLQKALASAVFPRSHAGVISITKVYAEIAP